MVTGSDYVRFKGSADANGVAGYGFMVWAGDGTGSDDADTFRIKITDGLGNTVYDNGMDPAIGGGSIIVHKGK